MTITLPIRTIFDVETKWVSDNPYEPEITSVTLINTENPDEILFYEEDEMDACMEYLIASPGLVGFNSKGFDLPVLMKYVDRGNGRLIRSKPHYDIYDEFMRIHRRRISLNNIARNTLGIGKFELTNNTAISLWKNNPKMLLAYNAYDTYLTYLLYVHTVAFGGLSFKLPTLQRFVPETISRPSI